MLAAKSWVLYDYNSGQMLIDEKGSDHIEPAALTKLMTAYLTFIALREHKLAPTTALTPLDDELQMQKTEARMYLAAGQSVTVDELLHGLIVDSGSDAAHVLAKAVAGNEAAFVGQMNQEAQRLGMRDTHFVNASGLPDAQHYSSAHDLVLLAAAIIRDFPDQYARYSQKEYEYNTIRQSNPNRLLWLDPTVDGMGTGHAESAGFCLVASALRGQRRLISVMIGASSDNLRASESQKLLNYGFQHYQTVRMYQKNQPVTQLRIWKGTTEQLAVGFSNDLLITVPSGQLAQLKATLETRQPLSAPITSGQQIGTMKFTLNGKPYAEYPLVALDTVPLANVLSRGWDSLLLLFE